MPFNSSILLLVVISVRPFSGAHNGLFWRRYGKKLNSSPVSKVPVGTPEDCLGVCKLYDGCKAFNVHQVTMVCELFHVDRCDKGLPLVKDRERSYFDYVADGQCPLRK